MRFFAICIALFALSACDNVMNKEAAQRIAAPAWMFKNEIPAGEFLLTTYERSRKGSSIAQIYIGGSGVRGAKGVWEDVATDDNPTTGNPVALHLAAKADTSKSVVWIARPCQYSGLVSGEECPSKYWTTDKFAPEVIDAYNIVLDRLIKKYGFNGFEIIGYADGAVIAAQLAADRSDIISFRSVAGALDEAVDIAPLLKRMPQHHFIGGQDESQVPAEVLYEYLGALGKTNCVSHTVVPEATHEAGWVERWPSLLKQSVSCVGRP